MRTITKNRRDVTQTFNPKVEVGKVKAKATFSLLFLAGVYGLLVIAIWLIPTASSEASVPKLINYQGVLKDSLGVPYNGDATMVFSIWDDSTNGNKLWDQQSLYQVPSGQEGYSLQRTSDNGYIITGVTLVYYPDDEYYSDDILLLKLSGNQALETPSKPSGPANGEVGIEYTYSTSTTDSEGYKIYYNFSWGDGTYSGWLGPYNSGETASGSHIWEWQGTFYIKVKAKDDPNNDGDLSDGAESDWSETTSARIPKNKEKTLNTQLFNFLQICQIFYQLIQRCLKL